MYIWVIGIAASILTASGLVTQVLKGFIRKKVDDVSIVFMIVGGTGTFLWFIYGILINNGVIIFANSINATCYALILLQKNLYKSTNERLETVGEKS